MPTNLFVSTRWRRMEQVFERSKLFQDMSTVTNQCRKQMPRGETPADTVQQPMWRALFCEEEEASIITDAFKNSSKACLQKFNRYYDYALSIESKLKLAILNVVISNKGISLIDCFWNLVRKFSLKLIIINSQKSQTVNHMVFQQR